jgi:hypothetical protein
MHAYIHTHTHIHTIINMGGNGVGPKRSGSSIHIDPLATSAWNSVISGRKRWVCFPPGTPKSAVKPPGPNV